MPTFAEPPLPEEEVDAIINLLKRGAHFTASDGSALDESVALAKLRMAGATYHYDCLVSPPDPRDVPLPRLPRNISTLVDFRPTWPHIEQQGTFGTCGSNSTTSGVEYFRYQAGDTEDKSRMATYWWARKYDDLLGADNGCTIRSALKSLQKIGAPPESMWPYRKEYLNMEPTAEVVSAAASCRISGYYNIRNGDVEAIRGALAMGYPIVLGLYMFSGFEGMDALRTGKIPLPKDGEASKGGHAVDLVGYNDATQCFIGANSWGNWGDKGFFYLPYEYVENFSFDSWCISGVQ